VIALRALLEEKIPVISLDVAAGLHLKSVCSHLDENTIVVADTPFGRYFYIFHIPFIVFCCLYSVSLGAIA
jgi:hypothetical protein